MAVPRTKAAPMVAPRPAPTGLPGWLMAALLALATLVLYWPALQNGFVNFDDDRYLTANQQVQQGLTFENLRWAFTHSVTENWHPLTVLSYMAVCQFQGLNPWWHHLVSLMFHAANAGLVFLLLRRLTGAVWPGVAVALLFAFHPLRVESVAWVAERKDVLSGFFGLLTLYFYARYAQAQNKAGARKPFYSSSAWWLALGSFALGLMSKPMLVTWPFVMLLLDYWPLNRMANFPSSSVNNIGSSALPITKLVQEKIPFFLLSAAVSVVTFLVQQQGAAVMTLQRLPLALRCENSLVAYCRYLGKVFWPVDLAVLYPYADKISAAVAILCAVLLVGFTIFAWRQRRQHAYLLVGWLWFLGTLIPVIGLVQVGTQSMADRYTYLPSLGVVILVVWGMRDLTQQWRLVPALPVLLCVGILIPSAMATRRQLAFWHDSETLFRQTLAVTENNPLAHYNLGVALDEKGRIEDAIHEYEACLQIQSGNLLAHFNLGAEFEKSGRLDEALSEFKAVMEADKNNYQPYNNIGIILFRKGLFPEAITNFREAIRLAPASVVADNAVAHNSLAVALYTTGQIDEAISHFNQAIGLKPDYAEAHYNLACVLAKSGQTAEAIKHFQEVLRLKPDYPEAQARLQQLLALSGQAN